MGTLRRFMAVQCVLWVAGACGSAVVCGPGTHLEGGVCLPDLGDGGAAGDGGGMPTDSGPAIDALVPSDAGSIVDGGCHPCELAVSAICDGPRVLRCVALADGCTALSLEQTCSEFFECRGGACRLRAEEPAGFTQPTPRDPQPEDLLWDGTYGTVVYDYATTEARDGATFRFDASGVIRPPHRTSIGSQEEQLLELGSRTFVYERVAELRPTPMDWYALSELAADGTATMLVRHDVCTGSGSARQAYGIDGTAVLFTRGASCGVELYTPGASASALSPSVERWFYGTSVLPASLGSGFALLWIPSGAASIDQQRFASDGTAIGTPSVNVVDLHGAPAPLDAFVALPGGGYFAVWSQYDPPDAPSPVYHLYAAVLDATGAATSTRTLTTRAQPSSTAPAYLAGALPSGDLLLAVPQESGSARLPLVIAQLRTDGAVVEERLVSGPGGVARYAAGTLAICRGSVDPEPDGVRCSVSTW